MEELPQFKTNIFMFTELIRESRKLNFSGLSVYLLFSQTCGLISRNGDHIDNIVYRTSPG